MQKPETLSVRTECIPVSIKAVPRWVLWKWELRKGKWAKTPRQLSGQLASTSDRHTWCDYLEAEAAYSAGGFDGLGLVLPAGIVGVDLDDCIGSEGLSEDARMIMAMLPTYTEVSPSGRGLKLLATGRLDDRKSKISRARGIEMYDGESTNRFFTITGHRLGTHERLTGQSEQLAAIQAMITDPPSERAGGLEDDHAAQAVEYLSHLKATRADDYDQWLRVGMALSWCDRSDEMLDRWIQWSEQSDNFGSDRQCQDKWESFRRQNGRLLTITYLEQLARADGYDPDRYQTGSVSAAWLCEQTIERDYLIEDFMVAGEPMVIGGASKALKTSIALDMAVSIATGTKFMERFDVRQKRRVMFLSGESGEKTLQDSLRSMAAQKQLAFGDLDLLHIGFKLPKLDSAKCVDDLIVELKTKEIDILFVDPLYRSLRVGDAASNVYAMGEQLELIAEKIHRAGITAVLLHHFRKQGRTYTEPPELEDLSQAGMAEFGRQFLLLKRREQYAWDGKHSLWFYWGGSAGHQGGLMLDVYTGTRQSGLTWQTTLRSEDEWKATREEEKTVDREQRLDDLRERILDVIGANPGIKTEPLREAVGGKTSTIHEILAELESAMEIHCEQGKKRARLWYRNEE